MLSASSCPFITIKQVLNGGDHLRKLKSFLPVAVIRVDVSKGGGGKGGGRIPVCPKKDPEYPKSPPIHPELKGTYYSLHQN